MSKYTRSEIAFVAPLRGLDTYTVKIKIHTEQGDTKWITVPADKVDELFAVVESFEE